MSLPCAAYNFDLLSGSSVMFHCVEPHPQKNVKPNKRAVSTKSTRIAIILNPPAGPLRRSAKTSKRIRSLVFLWEKEYTSELFFVFVFVLFVSSCVSLVCSLKKMGYGPVKPRIVPSCVVYARKTSNFGPCIRKLTGQSIRGVSSKKNGL